MTDLARLKWCTPPLAVHFVLESWINKAKFYSVLDAISDHGTTSGPGGSRESHWQALDERARGQHPWLSIHRPPDGDLGFVEHAKAWNAGRYSVRSLLEALPYLAFEGESIQYTVDCFNPGNELGLPYAGAGEPVLSLLMREIEFGAVQYRLVERRSFYSLIRRLDEILGPSAVSAANPNPFYGLLEAYSVGAAPPDLRPWDLLHNLTVVQTTIPIQELQLPLLVAGPGKLGTFKLGRVEEWSNGRMLIQVGNGLDAYLDDVYPSTARLFGRRAIHEYRAA